VLDRASTFAHPQIVNSLKSEFVPVALDQASTRRQQDTEGDFYRSIVLQRSGFKATTTDPKVPIDGPTTQGFYIANAAGDLLLYNNNRDPDKVASLLKQTLLSHDGERKKALAANTTDKRYAMKPPKEGLVIRVQAKVMGGYKPTEDRWTKIFQNALSRDNLWISAAEHQSLVNGEIPESLTSRLARFHLVDNTRGEPLMWTPDEIKHIALTIDQGVVRGSVLLKSADNSRGYEAKLRGAIETSADKVTRFDMVASGQYWGAGPYTRKPPPGKFPLAISFTLADGTDLADALSPQAARGWLENYFPK
jgi:hypothetical protein